MNKYSTRFFILKPILGIFENYRFNTGLTVFAFLLISCHELVMLDGITLASIDSKIYYEYEIYILNKFDLLIKSNITFERQKNSQDHLQPNEKFEMIHKDTTADLSIHVWLIMVTEPCHRPNLL